MSKSIELNHSKYVVSDYLEGSLTDRILKEDFASNSTSAAKYSKYYILSFLSEFGFDTIRSPHSGAKRIIDRHMIDVLDAFRIPLSKAEYFEKFGDNKHSREYFQLLFNDKFLFEDSIEQDRQFNLLNLEIDPNTLCNQACTYCPVATAPRSLQLMPIDMFEDILQQAKELSQANKINVYLTSYNEVTLDKRYPDFVKKILEKGMDHTVISNASLLTPSLTDELAELGMTEFELNIPSIDPDEYKRLTGRKYLKAVLRNVDYLVSKGLKGHILVHGAGDIRHYTNYKIILNRFTGTSVSATMGKTMDRAGAVQSEEYHCDLNRCKLSGCMSGGGTRVINWLHVNALGECFICPMDYDYDYLVGDLRKESVREVLTGDKMAKIRRLAYGVEQSDNNFICKRCMASISASWKDIRPSDLSMRKSKLLISKIAYKYRALEFHLPLYLKYKQS
ncbi:hypothetical protein MNBD_GAMMA26-19 [hydrothermal vent metagenome]|uniref:Radical SAM domain protein n=1 Tax=hydrothermal vent metagenome TaxID=652676 RepID=A0A3B1BBC0_9ZZZZ